MLRKMLTLAALAVVAAAFGAANASAGSNGFAQARQTPAPGFTTDGFSDGRGME